MKIKPKGFWSMKDKACVVCGTTKIDHEGYGLCISCYSKSSHGKNNCKKYYTSEKGKERYRRYGHHLKEKAISYYSDGKMCCKQCGYNDIRALALDHVDDGGGKHRKTVKVSIGAWCRTQKYPPGFQVLCMNCNWIKEMERRKSKNERHT